MSCPGSCLRVYPETSEAKIYGGIDFFDQSPLVVWPVRLRFRAFVGNEMMAKCDLWHTGPRDQNPRILPISDGTRNHELHRAIANRRHPFAAQSFTFPGTVLKE